MPSESGAARVRSAPACGTLKRVGVACNSRGNLYDVIHRFTPTRYHNTLGSHQPALHIADGDTVETSTVDAIGNDANGVCVAERSNPQTGPFYVDGAAPGDTLAVRLDHIWP